MNKLNGDEYNKLTRFEDSQYYNSEINSSSLNFKNKKNFLSPNFIYGLPGSSLNIKIEKEEKEFFENFKEEEPFDYIYTYKNETSMKRNQITRKETSKNFLDITHE